ncbi:histone-lysine N-methyltransferase, H3 lysine-9 specific SUVH5-like [Cornus florida]|uniref:histone-lysine N-methyltransferase, H3 lysine-9 specific SUVH5-like n=1 Tax=Cornus florida TaxID=4283 RepID=UPI00289FB4C3|nr:histone-lysine N-methyltransferase, H3 lysine-9 specific SUVH5-like [Cornus florida]
MKILLNGGLSDGNSRKRTLENGYSSSSIVSEFKYKPRKVSCVRDYPPGCGPNAPPIHLRQKENVVDDERRTEVVVDCVGTAEVRVEFQSHEVLKIRIRREMAESSGGLVGKAVDMSGMVSEDENISTKNYPERRVSVTRDYPPFCGRNAPCPTEEERQRVILRNKSVGGTERAGAKGGSMRETVVAARASTVVESKRNVGDGNAQTNESRGTVPEPRNKSQTVIIKDSEDARDSLGKMPKEIMVHSHSCGVDRMRGQGLMASPYGQRKQRKRASKTIPDGKIKLKKQDFTRQEKSMSAGKAAFRGIGAPPVWDEEDSVLHDDVQRNHSHQFRRLNEFDARLPHCYGPNSSNHGDARYKVREMLRLFQTTCWNVLQREEAKLRQSKRIDLEAIKILKEKQKGFNTGKQILGAVPGVRVGDEFQYRVELVLIGMHRRYQDGIDYMTYGGQIIATSIVASGGYDDDLDNADVLIYSGQGGKPVGRDKLPEDQKLVKGNLALKNSISVKNPVRVIRGSRETKASSSSDARAKMVMTYTYDGLYNVKRYWQEPGPHGKLVYKFKLTRIPGQPGNQRLLGRK